MTPERLEREGRDQVSVAKSSIAWPSRVLGVTTVSYILHHTMLYSDTCKSTGNILK